MATCASRVGENPKIGGGAAAVEVTTVAPTYNSSTDVITIPATTGVVYSIDGEDVPSGPTDPIAADTVVQARPAPGYRFSPTSDNDWTITYVP